MKKIILFLICGWISGSDVSAFPLSGEAEISVLTCSPGRELYSLFGHTAIRIRDTARHYDRVFNYGTFDFSTPHFYLKYARGLLLYQLTESSFPCFIYAYQMEGRSVYSQTLQLDLEDKQRLFDLLTENSRPENRSYLYNFLFDNCTTKSRDLLTASMPETIDWKAVDRNRSFWNLLDEYLQTSPWVQWGIHTILGQRGNRRATPFQYMFLPDYFKTGLDSACYNGHRLVGKTQILHQAPDMRTHTPWYGQPAPVFALGTVLLIVLLALLKSRSGLDAVSVLAFLITGILGGLIVFLGGFTRHPITAPNWNILWANPLNIVALFFLAGKTLPPFVRIYLKLYFVLLTVAIPVWIFTRPAVPLSSLSLIVLMMYLSYRQILDKKS